MIIFLKPCLIIDHGKGKEGNNFKSVAGNEMIMNIMEIFMPINL